MSIFENPFYILGATTRDNRSKINQLAEEMSLLTSSDECTVARNILTNPSKRLSAEINWFSGLSPKNVDLIIKYVTDLKEKRTAYLKIETFNLLAQLNIIKEKFVYHDINDFDGIIDIILDINDTFEATDFDDILTIVNEDRIVSRFPLIEETMQVEGEFKQVRLDIQNMFNSTFTKYSQEEYIKIINKLANECIDENEILVGLIINDILEAYKLKTKDLIEKQADDLITLAENVKNEVGNVELDFMVDYLIQKVDIFDRLAQPLQLKARSEGTSHIESEEVARVIRNLAVELHNNLNATDLAIKLTNCLKTTFAELDEFAERTKIDSETLNSIKQQKQAEKAEHDKMVAENTSDKNYSVTVLKDRFAIPPYCTCCFKPTDDREHVQGSVSRTIGRTTRTRNITLDFPICSDCLKHRKQISSKKWILFLLSLAVSAGLFVILCLENIEYNTLVGIYSGIAIAVYLSLGYYMKLPYITPNHSTWEKSVQLRPISMDGEGVVFEFTNWRYADWFAEANKAKLEFTTNRSRVKKNKLIPSLDHPILVCISIISIVLLISIFIGPSIYQTLSYNPNSNSSSQSQSNPQNHSTSTPSNPSKYDQMNEIEVELDTKKIMIQRIETDLENMESDLDYYENMFSATNDNYYADEYNWLLGEYQSLHDDYEAEINEYNRLVEEYNAEYAQ